ncbi:MAG TPA: hypothetical protein PKZ88_08110 [Methanothermobacter sp.]|nr:hypothetical protein [Methanothermobacter sp.]
MKTKKPPNQFYKKIKTKKNPDYPEKSPGMVKKLVYFFTVRDKGMRK